LIAIYHFIERQIQPMQAMMQADCMCPKKRRSDSCPKRKRIFCSVLDS
jgi:hypothetical protein